MISLFSANLDGALIVKEGAIIKAWSVFNPELAQNFATQRGILERRMNEDPGLFKKSDWQKADRPEVRTISFFELN